MLNVDVAEFQKGLPNYMKQIGNGEEIQISSKGCVVARVIPVKNKSDEARKRLELLRGTVITGDVLSPIGENDWGIDENHL
ncbi:MAG: type II toxin-antitoxin system prevent-host-death family antitoxin [Magnetococcales bacterium]|nr:type II toxin-antitoxin system prevent-host-death family antitoxin [Magnetococcales bacterium]